MSEILKFYYVGGFECLLGVVFALCYCFAYSRPAFDFDPVWLADGFIGVSHSTSVASSSLSMLFCKS